MARHEIDQTIWLLWDGECDFCQLSAAWMSARNPHSILTIIPYQDAPSPPMTPAFRVQAARAVQVVTAEGTCYSGASAVMFALESVGWHAGIARSLRKRPLRWGADALYWLIARNRSRLARLGH